jgi:hypothetical protein
MNLNKTLALCALLFATNAQAMDEAAAPSEELTSSAAVAASVETTETGEAVDLNAVKKAVQEAVSEEVEAAVEASESAVEAAVEAVSEAL